MHININDVKIFFDVYGSKLNITDVIREKPTLLFLHGGPGLGDHSLYTKYWSKFFDIAQVIFIDHRGNGRSDEGKKEKWNLSQWGKDIYTFCKKLNIQKPIIAGVSFGGHVALSCAIQYPELPNKLILCNSEAKFDKKLREKYYRKLGGDRAGEIVAKFDNGDNTEETLNDYIKYCFPLFSKNPYTDNELNNCIRKTETWNYFKTNELYKFDYSNLLKKIICPILLLSGDKDPEHPYIAAEKIKKQLPELTTFKLIEDAGDPVYRDKPIITESIIRKFIKAL